MANLNTLLHKILRRKNSFLQLSIDENASAISDAVSKSKILVIGAAGSIGAAFVRELVSFRPASLHLIDISENNLVEVVRDLRSGGCSLPNDFKTHAIDFGQAEMKAFLNAHSYDYILNFAALKHVRSQRDPFTLMRLLNVNILANHRLVLQLLETGVKPKRIFAVSSDKAVCPGNVMGASKAFMERVFLAYADRLPFSSARFANVAFSDGSLLHGFQKRIEKRQPLSAPNDIRRYFISSAEAGQLCLLGCFACHNCEIVYPLFKPEKDLMTFSDIAQEYLQDLGLEPVECESEESAREMAQQLDQNSKQWPCYFTASDTGGEKPFEEFVNPGEEFDNSRFPSVGVITKPSQSLEEIVGRVVSEMSLVNGEKNLDEKM